MLLKSYTKNYLYTYFWQGISVLLNLCSLLIVIPLISENKFIYGIYSICVSFSIFLNYADLGFVSAAVKYAGELYAQNNRDEIKFYGFSTFILLIFISLIVLTFIYFSYNPQILIKDIVQSNHLKLASSLLLIQALFSYNVVLQKYTASVFQVRIEQYIFQRLSIVGNIIKISSVFYFFRTGHYDIVGYFFFIKFVEFLTQLIGIYIIQKRYNISLVSFITNIRFNVEIFKKTKDLAFSSFFVTIAWIIYYELDIIVIGKIFGATEVAIFSLAFIFTHFLRTISSVIFSPFQNRYNHLIGLKDYEGLKNIIEDVIFFTMPIFIFGIIIIVSFNENIILSWAGEEYFESSLILLILSLCHIFNFIIIPGSNILVSLERIKEMYIINLLIVIIFWTGIYLFYQKYGVLSFPVFKLVTTVICMIFYLRIILSILDVKFIPFLLNTTKKLLIPTIFIITLTALVSEYLPDNKSYFNFIIILISSALCFLATLLLLILLSNYYYNKLKLFYMNFKKR